MFFFNGDQFLDKTVKGIPSQVWSEISEGKYLQDESFSFYGLQLKIYNKKGHMLHLDRSDFPGTHLKYDLVTGWYIS